MPGELGDEQEQQQVGYYEKRYEPAGAWADPNYASVQSWGKKSQPGDTMRNLMKRLKDRQRKMEWNQERKNKKEL